LATAAQSIGVPKSNLVKKTPMGGRRASDVGIDGELTNSMTIKKDDEAFKTNKPDKRTTNA